MSKDTTVRYFVTNHQSQPLELYLESAHFVLGPREETEVREADLASAQLNVLRRKRLVTVRKAVETPEAAQDVGAVEAGSEEKKPAPAGKIRSAGKKEG